MVLVDEDFIDSVCGIATRADPRRRQTVQLRPRTMPVVALWRCCRLVVPALPRWPIDFVDSLLSLFDSDAAVGFFFPLFASRAWSRKVSVRVRVRVQVMSIVHGDVE